MLILQAVKTLNVLASVAAFSSISLASPAAIHAEGWTSRRCSLMASGLVELAGDCLYRDHVLNLYDVVFEGKLYRLDARGDGAPKLFIDNIFVPKGDGNYNSSLRGGCSLFIALARTTKDGPARVQAEDYPLGLCVSQ